MRNPLVTCERIPKDDFHTNHLLIMNRHPKYHAWVMIADSSYNVEYGMKYLCGPVSSTVVDLKEKEGHIHILHTCFSEYFPHDWFNMVEDTLKTARNLGRELERDLSPFP